MLKKLFIRWCWELLFGGIFFAVYLAVGAYLALIRHYLPGDALSRLVSAYLVFYGTQPKLATIGFIWPPIPTLLLLPFAWIPFMVETWLAPVVVSAISMSVAVVLIGRIGNLCNVPTGWRIVFMILFALNPMIVMFGANGMSEAILIVAALGACYWLIQFWGNRRDTALILAASFFGLLPMIRYEMLVLTAGGGLLILLLTWGSSQQLSADKFANLLEGRMLAYAALAVYPTFLWVVASWQIMGHPLYFLINERSALSVAIFQIVDMGIYDTSPLASMGITFGIWFTLFPLGIITTLVAGVVGMWRRSLFMIGLSLLPLIPPFVQGVLLMRQTTVPLLRYYIMVIPLAGVVALACWKEILDYLQQANYRLINARGIWFFAPTVLIFVGSNFAMGSAFSTSIYQSIESQTWSEMGFSVEKIVPLNHIPEAIAVGRTLLQIVPPGTRILLDAHGRGFAVILGARDPKMFLNHTDPRYDAAVLAPWQFADYVLIPDPSNEEVEGGLDVINQAHPGLYKDGEPWAKLVEGLPRTAAGWRLYRMKPSNTP